MGIFMSKDSTTEESTTEESGGAEMGLLSHLVELRDRLLRMLLVVGVLFLCLFPFADKIWTALALPLLKHGAGDMIAIDVASPFLIPFKVVLMLSVVLAAPYLLYQIWAFVAPGLYTHEKRLVSPLLISSTLLFYMGIAFAYFVVFPLVFAFFNNVAPDGVTVSTDISRYLDFILTIFLAFGIAFEVPIATILLVAVGAATPDGLAKKRPYFIVCAFVVGMFLTPPDIISQTLLALPMWLLFEVGIFFSRIFLKRKEEFSRAADARHQENDISPDVAKAKATVADDLVVTGDQVDHDDHDHDEHGYDDHDHEALEDEELAKELELLNKQQTAIDDEADSTRDEDKPGP